MVHTHVAGDGPATLAILQSSSRGRDLVDGEFMFAAHLHALGFGGAPAVFRALDDAFALVLCKCGQKGENALAERRRQIEIRAVEHLEGARRDRRRAG